MRQIPYDLPYKWNLINKTNKQPKYNQGHWNKEQTDSNQRGGGKEIIGEGPLRNMYEGHIDKAKGGMFKSGRHRLVGQGSWKGEDVDNYTWTTIKKRECYTVQGA